MPTQAELHLIAAEAHLRVARALRGEEGSLTWMAANAIACRATWAATHPQSHNDPSFARFWPSETQMRSTWGEYAEAEACKRERVSRAHKRAACRAG